MERSSTERHTERGSSCCKMGAGTRAIGSWEINMGKAYLSLSSAAGRTRASGDRVNAMGMVSYLTRTRSSFRVGYGRKEFSLNQNNHCPLDLSLSPSASTPLPPSNQRAPVAVATRKATSTVVDGPAAAISSVSLAAATAPSCSVREFVSIVDISLTSCRSIHLWPGPL